MEKLALGIGALALIALVIAALFAFSAFIWAIVIYLVGSLTGLYVVTFGVAFSYGLAAALVMSVVRTAFR